MFVKLFFTESSHSLLRIHSITPSAIFIQRRSYSASTVRFVCKAVFCRFNIAAVFLASVGGCFVLHAVALLNSDVAFGISCFVADDHLTVHHAGSNNLLTAILVGLRYGDAAVFIHSNFTVFETVIQRLTACGHMHANHCGHGVRFVFSTDAVHNLVKRMHIGAAVFIYQILSADILKFNICSDNIAVGICHHAFFHQ